MTGREIEELPRALMEDDQVPTLGSTLEFSRDELKDKEPDEDPLRGFLRSAARDSNIEGVAVSRIHGGGIYTEWFVRSFSDIQKMQETIQATSISEELLGKAAQDQAGYGGYINMDGRPFEEVEEGYRSSLGVVDINRFPFDRGMPHNHDLELLLIARFK